MVKSNLFFDFRVNKEDNTVTIQREFAAAVDLVWAAWTRPELLDRWWAPKPWKAETKQMDFRPGGAWLYSMVGPEGERHHCRADYRAVAVQESFTALDGFCDADGKLNTELPRNTWETRFRPTGETTTVHVQLSFDSLQDLETIIEMGFREGFTAALNNLDELLLQNGV